MEQDNISIQLVMLRVKEIKDKVKRFKNQVSKKNTNRS